MPPNPICWCIGKIASNILKWIERPLFSIKFKNSPTSSTRVTQSQVIPSYVKPLPPGIDLRGLIGRAVGHWQKVRITKYSVMVWNSPPNHFCHRVLTILLIDAQVFLIWWYKFDVHGQGYLRGSPRFCGIKTKFFESLELKLLHK